MIYRKFAVVVALAVSVSTAVSSQVSAPPTLTLAPQPPAAMAVGAFTVGADRGVYFAGTTTDAGFPTTPGAYSRRCGVDGNCGRTFFGNPFGLRDVVVTKVTAGGAIERSTFLGGDGQLSPQLIALGPDGSVYVAGEFRESPFIGPQRMPFANPTVPGCGQFDIFVAKLAPATFALVYWTCVQGPYKQAPITVFDIAVDQTNALIIAGYVNNVEFPVHGVFPPLNARRSGVHGYIKKLLANGDVAFAGILGGGELDSIWSMAVDREANIYIAGTTSSADLPVSRPLQASRSGPTDGFVTKLDPDGRLLLFSTYLGGSATDVVWGIAVDNNNEAWVVGDTHSVDFPTTADALRPVSLCGANPACTNRNPSAFLARFDGTGRLRYSTLLGPDRIDPNGPGGARLVDVLVGPRNELQLLGDFADTITPIRPLSTQTCGTACGILMTIAPGGDIRFASRLQQGNFLASFSSPSRGRWALGPNGELYLFRFTATFATELVIIGVNQF